MKKYSFTLLGIFIWFTLYSQRVLACLADQCLLGMTVYTKSCINNDIDKLPVYIYADKAVANYPEYVLFSGNVYIKQGNSVLSADEVYLTRLRENNQEPLCIVTATGNVNYTSNKIKLYGSKAWYNINTTDTDVYHGNYCMVGRQGRGDASTMKQRSNNRYTVLKNGSFTSCIPGDNSWSIVGSEIIHDHEKQVAEIWNARFKISKLSVFYIPYLQIPVGEKRRNGFLIPNIKYTSNNGLQFSIPYYLNIAPNYDATITPNYISKLGIQIRTEFRYLTALGKGMAEFDWLPNDHIYSSEYISDNNRDRWLLCWQHDSVINQVWRFNVDYTKVGNLNYFNKIDSKYRSNTDSYTKQKFSFGYADEDLDLTLSCKQFQLFETNSKNNYCATPQFDLTYYKHNIGPLNLRVFSQAVKFSNVNNNFTEAIRLHIEPTLILPLVNHCGSLNTEAKLMATHYKQKNIDYYSKNTTGINYLKYSVNRILPQFKTHGKVILKRNMDYGPKYTQILEPRLQYLYVPYFNHKDIGIYDSTSLQANYFNLFYDRTYSGLDRILSANQLTSSITTRIYDDQHVERFNASLGQIYYFLQPYISNTPNTWDNYNNTSNIVLVGDSYWRISNQWGICGGLQYDSSLNSIMLGDAVLEYRRNDNRILQLNYHYASQQYIEQMLSAINPLNYQYGISQIGITGSWPIINHWSMVGAYYYDTKANQSANQLISLQYNTCCWAVNVGYERKITSWNSTNSSSQYENKVSFNIELRGLNNNYSLSTDKMLRSGMIPYQEAF